MREPANAECGRSVDVVRVRRVDEDLADAAPEEGVSTRRDARVRSVVHAGVGELRPVVAAVRRPVDTDARFAAGAAAIGLAGTEVERVAARVVGIGGQRADRVLRDPAREVCPARVRCESVVRPPNATAGGAHPETAVTRHARRRDDENWATGCGCTGLTGEREHAGLDSVLQRPVRLPVVVVSRVALGGDGAKSVLGVLHHRRRDHVGRIGARRGFVRLVPANWAFARYSAGVSRPASRSPAILALTGRSCDNWLDGLLTLTSLPAPAKKAIAVAAEISVPALAKRTVETNRFCLNECEVFILDRG